MAATNCPSSTPSHRDHSPLQPNPTRIAGQGSHQGRKFNVVLFGVPELPKGTKRVVRLAKDTATITAALTGLDSSISSYSIRDCFRLGKFQDNSARPRPVLVKLNWVADVQCALSKASSLPHSMWIKPDLNPEERVCQSILLKTRWSLLQSGFDKSDIKIRGSRINIKGSLYGHVAGSAFVCDNAGLASVGTKSSDSALSQPGNASPSRASISSHSDCVSHNVAATRSASLSSD